ncbi:MAG TPA: GGDEF domain-containing protein, partial [Rubrivivax sp.]|nr:GGDEF domain-containing protein [Rubrivivax sp.]
YAGAPLLSSDGHAIGTLCVIDRVPTELTPAQVSALHALSRQVTHLLELRRAGRQLNTQLREREWYEQQLQRYHEQLERQNADLSEQTRTDPLTGLCNRRAFAAAVDTAMQKAQGTGQGLAIAILDVDHFKMINDLHGHAEGDQVLVALADMLKAQFAGRGMAARYGGEEFVMLFTECTLDLARLQCELIRQSVSMLPVGLPFTVSIGVAEARPGDSSEQMFKRADAALYAAKRGGRDRVVVGE